MQELHHTLTGNTLSRLWAGETIAFEAPENSGGMSISQPSSTDTFRADRDRWLYLQVDFPGGLARSWLRKHPAAG